MTEGEFLRLCADWQWRLGLSHWRIEFVVEEMDEDVYARCDMPTDYDRARIRFQPWLLTHSEPQRAELSRRTIDDRIREVTAVHELLHCALHTLDMTVRVHLDGLLHRDAYTVVTEVYDGHEERTIEGLATALVDAWHAGDDR